MASFTFSLVRFSCSSFHTSINTSIEVPKARDTLASSVSTLPRGTGFLKCTWFTEAVTTTCSEWRSAAIQAARSMRANSSPPNKLLMGLVSEGSTKSVITVLEALGCFGSMGVIFSVPKRLGNCLPQYLLWHCKLRAARRRQQKILGEIRWSFWAVWLPGNSPCVLGC